MQRGEYKYLLKEKLSEGLCIETAKNELSKLENSQKLFKNITRELKKKDTEIKNLNKKVQELKQKLTEEKDKHLKENLEVIAKSETPIKEELNIVELSRILKTIKFHNEPLTQREIEKKSLLKKGQAGEGLRFLTKNKLVKYENKKFKC